MKIVIILNDPPYGTERSYNGLRLAHSRGSMDGLSAATLEADKVMVF